MKLSSKLSRSRLLILLTATLAVLGIGVAAAQPALATPLASLMHNSASSHPVLRYGAHGPSVKSAQSALNKHGAHLSVDGVFGPATLRAVKSFQRSHGLSVDGIVGPNTWGRLGAGGSSKPAPTSSSHPVLRYGAHGPSVKSAQSALNKHGAHLSVDGVFGPATLRAVKSFQRSHGLSVDGIVGPNTWSHLGASGSSKPAPTSNLTRLGISQAAINGARRSGASLDVSKRTGMMYFLRSSGGKVYVSRSSVVSFAGCNVDGCFHTPSGVFRVVKKGGAHERSIPWHGASMPYPVYFTWSGYAMHYDPLEPSHGCIHDPNYWQMKYIHDVISVGDVFVVHS